MHNTYISSNVLSLGTRGSLSFSFNDRSTLLNERFDRNPLLPLSSSSQCCSCCSCCASSSSLSFVTHRVPINPSLFYGLRQSTLVQCSLSRRLILGGRGRYYYQVPPYAPCHGCYKVSCTFKENGGSGGINRGKKVRFGRVSLRERHCLGAVDDVEAVISLLSEEVNEEYVGDRNRNRSLSKRVEVEDTKKRGNYGCGRKTDAALGLLQSDSKHEFELNTIDLGKEGHRRKVEREENKEREEKKSLSTDKYWERKSSSSVSSFYSLSTNEDFEDEKGAQNVEFLEESSTGYRKDLKSGESRSEGQAVEDFKRHRDVAEGHGKVMEQRTSATSAGVDWDWRKKSEKRLAEIEETQFKKEILQVHSRMASTHGSDYRNASSSNNQIDDKEEKVLTINLERGTRKQYSQMDNHDTEQSEYRSNYQGITDVQETHGTSVEKNSLPKDWVSSREENPAVDTELVLKRRDENRKTFGESAGKYNLRKNVQQLTDVSEIGNVERVSNLQRQPESKLKMHEEDRALSLCQEKNVQHHQVGGHVTGKIESRRIQHFSEISEIHDSNIKNTSILQPETRIKNQEGTTSVISSSGEERKEQRSHTEQKDQQETQSGRRSDDVSNMSVNVASGIEIVTNSNRTSEKRMIDQRSQLTSVVKPISEARERGNRTDEILTPIHSRNEAHRATQGLSFHEKTSQETSLNMVSQVRVQQIHEEGKKGNQKRRQAIMMPSSDQLISRGSLHGGMCSEMTTDEFSVQTLEGGSSNLYTNSGGPPALDQGLYGRDRKGETSVEPLNLLTPEDALGSTHRLEESSKQFLVDFVEKARHEVLTSEIQKGKGVSDPKLYEGNKHMKKSSGQYGSEDLDLNFKEQGSRKSSGGSGVKGPSDEMWDVKDPSLQEPSETGVPDRSTTTDNLVVKRTGGSLWSIIGNVVRLRWGSRAETPKSSRRLGVKSSSNDSVSSEAWFSGHDPDEYTGENVKRERKSMPKEATSTHEPQLRKTSSQDQEAVSDTIGSKDKIGWVEIDTSSPSTIFKSGSTSKAISSPSEVENLGWSRDGKSIQAVAPGMEIGESSLVQLPSSAIHSPIAEETSGAHKNDVSVGDLGELTEHSVDANISRVSGSEGKDGELKQRRLQRNKQVLRDRFDEWEEAYVRENEQRKIDEMFMREALLEAKKAADTWEVPVGAVLVHRGKIIARGYNLVEELRDSTAHAEILCIREASNQLWTWRLAETTLYVTLEPCAMCAGAILQARVDTLVWGAPNKLLGADGSWVSLFPDGGGGNGSELTSKPAAPVHPFHPKMKVRRGILASECDEVMQQFFQLRRKKKVKDEDPPPEPSHLPISNPQSKFLRKMHDIFLVMFCL